MLASTRQNVLVCQIPIYEWIKIGFSFHSKKTFIALQLRRKHVRLLVFNISWYFCQEAAALVHYGCSWRTQLQTFSLWLMFILRVAQFDKAFSLFFTSWSESEWPDWLLTARHFSWYVFLRQSTNAAQWMTTTLETSRPCLPTKYLYTMKSYKL